jgi:hypothetical protein
MSFFRTLQLLLPDAAAWRTTTQKQLRSFFEALGEAFDDIRTDVDLAYLDGFPADTREAAEWERAFGLTPATDATEDDRRAALAAEWQATGGQSPAYLEGILQTAGFDVYIHEWWESGPDPYVVRNPNDYTDVPAIGSVQCSDLSDQHLCSALSDQPQCDRFLANDPHYLVNKDLTPRAPPPIPDDDTCWPYFLYVGGETFPDLAVIPVERRDEFERLILKLRPTHNWIVTNVQFAGDGVFDDTFDNSFE